MMLRWISMLLLAVCFQVRADGQSKNDWEAPYYRGYVGYKTPLSLFVAPTLLPACAALERHDLATAEQAFAMEVQQHPDNLAAWLGLLQATRGHRDGWLPRFMAEVKTNPTAANHFKLGLLAWYQYAEKAYPGEPTADLKMSADEKQRRRDMAREHLEAAYRMTYALVAGFSLAGGYDYLRGNAKSIYEDMLQRLGGTGVYQTYLRAKQNGWEGEQPPIPKLSRTDLLLMSRMVAFLWSENSGRGWRLEQRVVNGKMELIDPGPPPYTAVQKQGELFLGKWKERLKAAANALPQQASASSAP